jgi:DNA-binding PadR family transcriptional regulator
MMTYLIDALEDAGLVSRHADPNDRRARRVVITERGGVLFGQLNERLAEVETHVLAALEEDERSAFRRLLQRVATHVDALDPVADACALISPEDRVERAPAPRPAARRRPRREPSSSG